MNAPPNLIIFDCDGVLVDSETVTSVVLAERLTDAGVPMTGDEAHEQFVGGTMAAVIEFGRERGANLAEDWLDKTHVAIFDRLKEGLTPIPHLDAFLTALDAAGIATCVASNGPMSKMEVTLPGAGLMERFAGRIYSAYEVGIAKPEPGLFLHAAKDQGYEPEETVVIEDSVSGVKAATAAGMRCYGYSEGVSADMLAAHGAIPFTSMADLPKLLGL